MKYNCVIIGGGAAGMAAAITALKEGQKVLIIETNSKLGKKILATGNGKCNFTHVPVLPTDYYCDKPELLESVLQSFGSSEAISFFEEMGMLTKNKNGYCYPITEQASTVQELLAMRLYELGCHILTSARNTKINRTSNGFQVNTFSMEESEKSPTAKSFLADTVILATGSKAGVFLEDKTENPYKMAQELGLHSSQLYPALTKCICKESCFKSVAGVRSDIVLEISDNGKKVSKERGELQLTAQGISGIVVFQMAGYIAQNLSLGHKICAHIDFLPDLTTESLQELVHIRYSAYNQRSVENLFLGVLHKKILQMFIKRAGLIAEKKASKYDEEALFSMISQAKNFETTITAVAEMKEAQVCHGGLLCDQFTNELQSKQIPGLFACGELLNVDGKCGGYNLHWAWASGVTAGASAANYADHFRE